MRCIRASPSGGVVDVLEQEIIPEAFNKFIFFTLCIVRDSGP